MKDIKNLTELSEYMGLPRPMDENFVVKRIEDYYNDFDEKPIKPFRHKLYAISLYAALNIDVQVGFWKVNPRTPFLMFKSPYQVMAWTVHPGSMRGWSVIFSEEFLSRHKQLANIIHDFPFLQLDKSIPFEIETEDRIWLEMTYQKILDEYRSEIPDKFELIASYLQTLLLQVKRLYNRQILSEAPLLEATNQHNVEMLGKFKSLLNDSLLHLNEVNQRSVGYYAEKLSVHPNHLNAMAKRVTGTTALHIIHEHIVHAAKTLLLQTTMTVKEVAYKLAFKEPTHFVTFFKKQTGLTPLQFREQKAEKVNLIL
ncbi:AraC family transcriptional regulator [Dyadobacter sp. CY356]|uniref:helix-turn-helix domain-containing protein n=1 Tax=Dyadobacter sp. CY356 TaxID=2906442 RepID=UPI001F3B09AB|nr:helix-turn-helix domain-containing protein [Dyadobacter sp. CY356]MCF0055429.1 helix-turn-helix domain-containing protein [Dyadobacter sp. CY356]